MKPATVKVLLIEDDEDDYVLTCDLLGQIKGTNYEIEWVSSYARAFDAVMSGDYDVCLIDYRLGEGNGTDLIRRAATAGCRAPMILLTGQGDREIDLEATEAGAADYLVKGEIEASLLERAIRYAVKQAQIIETLQESENRFRSIIESASDAIILTDGAGRILSWNTSAQMIFGYSPVEVMHRPLSYLFSAKNCGRAGKEMKLLLSSGILRLGNRSVELTGVRKYGEEFPLEISLSSWETSKGVFYGGIIRDVTERKEMVNQLTHQALHDPLTKLANRLLFHNRVEHALVRLERNNTPLAV